MIELANFNNTPANFVLDIGFFVLHTILGVDKMYTKQWLYLCKFDKINVKNINNIWTTFE